MTTVDKLFVLFYERKHSIIELVKERTELYGQHIASKLLIDGITPPSWLWDPNTAGSKELNKEDIFSKFLNPYPQPSACCSVAHYPGFNNVVITGDNEEFSPRDFVDNPDLDRKSDPASAFSGQDLGEHALNAVPEPDASVDSPGDQTDGRILNVDIAPDQYLAGIQRSKSRQKALELRSSAKALAKSGLRHESMSDISSHIRFSLPITNQPGQNEEPSQLAEPSVIGRQSFEERNVVEAHSISRETGGDAYSGRVISSHTRFSLPITNQPGQNDEPSQLAEPSVIGLQSCKDRNVVEASSISRETGGDAYSGRVISSHTRFSLPITNQPGQNDEPSQLTEPSVIGLQSCEDRNVVEASSISRETGGDAYSGRVISSHIRFSLPITNQPGQNDEPSQLAEPSVIGRQSCEDRNVVEACSISREMGGDAYSGRVISSHIRFSLPITNQPGQNEEPSQLAEPSVIGRQSCEDRKVVEARSISRETGGDAYSERLISSHIRFSLPITNQPGQNDEPSQLAEPSVIGHQSCENRNVVEARSISREVGGDAYSERVTRSGSYAEVLISNKGSLPLGSSSENYKENAFSQDARSRRREPMPLSHSEHADNHVKKSPKSVGPSAVCCESFRDIGGTGDDLPPDCIGGSPVTVNISNARNEGCDGWESVLKDFGEHKEMDTFPSSSSIQHNACRNEISDLEVPPVSAVVDGRDVARSAARSARQVNDSEELTGSVKPSVGLFRRLSRSQPCSHDKETYHPVTDNEKPSLEGTKTISDCEEKSAQEVQATSSGQSVPPCLGTHNMMLHDDKDGKLVLVGSCYIEKNEDIINNEQLVATISSMAMKESRNSGRCSIEGKRVSPSSCDFLDARTSGDKQCGQNLCNPENITDNLSSEHLDLCRILHKELHQFPKWENSFDMQHSVLSSSNDDLQLTDVDQSMPVFEGFNVNEQTDTDDLDFTAERFILGELELPRTTLERASILAEICRSASLDKPSSHFSSAFKFQETWNLGKSVPDGGHLEHMEFGNIYPLNPDIGMHFKSHSSSSDDYKDALDGKSYPVSLAYSGERYDWNSRNQPLSPIRKLWDQLSSHTGSSGKCSSSNPELACFPIEEDPSSSEDNEIMEEDAGDIHDKTNSLLANHSDKRQPLKDLTNMGKNPPLSVSAEEGTSEADSVDFLSSKFSVTGAQEDALLDPKYQCTEKNETRKKQTSSTGPGGRKYQFLSIAPRTAKKAKHSVSSSSRKSLKKRTCKPVMSIKTMLKGRDQKLSLKESKINNIVLNVSSFIPLVQQKQAATECTGKRDVKVKALEAAEAAKRLEEKKEYERKMRKEALKLERAKLEEKNLRDMELEKKKKDEERKKKDADIIVKKRLREEEDRKEKEKKKMRLEARHRQREQEEKKRKERPEKENQRPKDDQIHSKKEFNNESKRQQNKETTSGEGTTLTESNLTLNKVVVNHEECNSSVLSCEAGEVMHAVDKSPRKEDLIVQNCQGRSYEISPYQCSDDEDEEDDELPTKKYIPSWASKSSIALYLPLQQELDPDAIFPSDSFCSMDAVLLPRKLQQKQVDA